MKRNFSALTIEDAMGLLGRTSLLPWPILAGPRPPGAFLTEALRRLRVFDLKTSEAAKILLIDAVFAEVVPDHPRLKIWKAAPLESDTLTGVADYLIAPDYAYIALPLLCVTEAKRDDFVQGLAQCLAEIAACAEKNRSKGLDTDVYGIVSNGQSWQFYKRAAGGDLYESDQYSLRGLDDLLGALHYICGECARNVP